MIQTRSKRARITIRVESDLFTKLESESGNISENIRKILHEYYKPKRGVIDDANR